MKGIGFWFLLSGCVYVTLGMLWGIHMGMDQDFVLAPAHAHLNLLGWVTFALFGIYYHLVPQAAERPLARIHFAVATLGVWVIVPGIVLALSGRGEAVVSAGSLLTLASMVIFMVTVIRSRAV